MKTRHAIPTAYYANHWRFSRERTDGLPMEHSEPPLVSWGRDIAAAACIVILGLSAWLLLWAAHIERLNP